jgi:hypothetical protein
MQTREEYHKKFMQALEDHSKEMLADKKKCKAYLKEIGLWDILIPMKKKKSPGRSKQKNSLCIRQNLDC